MGNSDDYRRNVVAAIGPVELFFCTASTGVGAYLLRKGQPERYAVELKDVKPGTSMNFQQCRLMRNANLCRVVGWQIMGCASLLWFSYGFLRASALGLGAVLVRGDQEGRNMGKKYAFASLVLGACSICGCLVALCKCGLGGFRNAKLAYNYHRDCVRFTDNAVMGKKS